MSVPAELAPSGRLLRGCSTVSVAAALGACVAIGVLLAPGTASAATGSPAAAVQLSDDSGGTPLFQGSQGLVPGQTVVKCVAVDARIGPHADPHDVTVGASGVAGDLAQFLDLTIQVGTGGHFGDCTGFSGTEIYAGTLADLSGRGGGRGVATGWRPTTNQQRTFRFSMMVADRASASGTAAQGTLLWSLLDTGVLPAAPPLPTPPAGTIPGSPATAGIAPLPSQGRGAPSPATGNTGSGSRAGTDSTRSGGTPGAGTPGAGTSTRSSGSADLSGHRLSPERSAEGLTVPGQPGPTGSRGDGVRSRDVPSVLTKLISTVWMLASHAAYPLLIALLIALFLVIQHRLDANEPKLAEADVTSDRDLVFPHASTHRSRFSGVRR